MSGAVAVLKITDNLCKRETKHGDRYVIPEISLELSYPDSVNNQRGWF